MDYTAQAAVRIGHRHPAPVLALEELVIQVEGSLGQLPEESRSLDAHLRSRRDLFRVLDPWRGPLRPVRSSATEAGSCRPLLLAQGLPRRAWIVPRHSPEETASRDRIREGVAAFARAADEGSLRSILRLARLLREEEALRARGA